MVKSIATAGPIDKPRKPRKDFPLFPHASGLMGQKGSGEVCLFRQGGKRPQGPSRPCIVELSIPVLVTNGIGPTPEWHLVLGNAFQYIPFSHPSWFHEEVVPLFSPFQSARFIAVKAVSDAMNSKRVKQLLVKSSTKR